MVDYSQTNSADFAQRTDDAEYFVTQTECIDLGPKHFCPGTGFDFGVVHDNGFSSFGLFLSRGSRGLSWQLTSIGARELAGKLLEVADAIDARSADAAAAQLKATLQKDPRDGA